MENQMFGDIVAGVLCLIAAAAGIWVCRVENGGKEKKSRGDRK